MPYPKTGAHLARFAQDAEADKFINFYQAFSCWHWTNKQENYILVALHINKFTV